MTIIVTGCAGFIGAAVTERLLHNNQRVIGIDNINDYYDVKLKYNRLARLDDYEQFSFQQCDISDKSTIDKIFAQYQPQQVINLAAQAGVRYSIENPMSYVTSNLVGFSVILEACRQHHVEHLVYASSSSVYGNQTQQPFTVTQSTDAPISLYAATKKSNEVMAYSYSHLYDLKVTGLRYFTVYGPWGRPDMAPIKFTNAILTKQPLTIFNHGKHRRDFTYIDDIVDGTLQILNTTHSKTENLFNNPNYRLYNIGSGRAIELMVFIELLEKNLQLQANKVYVDAQPGDVEETYADISALTAATGYQPKISIEEGIKHFTEWYLGYYERGTI